MPTDQVLNFGREDVLAAGDDHLVVAAADIQQTSFVEVTDVARGQHAVNDLLASTAGVSGERKSGAHKDPTDLSLRHLPAVVVENLDLDARDDRPGGRR